MEIEISCINTSVESAFEVDSNVKNRDYSNIIMKDGFFYLQNNEKFLNIKNAAIRNYEIINRNFYELELARKLNEGTITEEEFNAEIFK